MKTVNLAQKYSYNINRQHPNKEVLGSGADFESLVRYIQCNSLNRTKDFMMKSKKTILQSKLRESSSHESNQELSKNGKFYI